MSLEPYDLRDPAALIDEIAGTVQLRDGAVHLVLVRDPSSEQHVVSVEKLRFRLRMRNWQRARRHLEQRGHAWEISAEWPARHLAILVAVRSGYCVLGPREAAWIDAMHFTNFLRPMFKGGLILVTEHGWVDWSTQHAGQQPSLVLTD